MKSFNDIPLPKNLRRALEQLKFDQPTEIQSATIPLALSGIDILGCAQTGSGKTAAYAIPLIAKLHADGQTQVLILAPTRELAAQIEEVCRNLTSFSRHLQSVLIIGGASMRRQWQLLQRHPRILIATPGRLNDLLLNADLDLSRVTSVVLDEADRMLDMGFAPQVTEILKYLSPERQTLMFSATLPKEILKLSAKFMKNPRRVDVAKSPKAEPKIHQLDVVVEGAWKQPKLLDVLRKNNQTAIVFAKTKRKTDKLASFLQKNGIRVGAIHGGRSQSQRSRALRAFRDRVFPVLVATDVAARGLDIPEIGLVINFDLPMTKEDYIHRIGRTARAGASGSALNFVTPQEQRAWKSLLRRA